MLTEIKCSEFKCLDNGGLITFNPTLNIILGSKSAANSIGKSTLLLIIDFVFGGNTYVEVDTEMLQELGPHSIQFAYKFSSRIYRFSRSTSQAKEIHVCGENYEIQDTIKINDFRAWLLDMYNMENLCASFRDLVSPFFRIYGKNNDREKLPLAARPGEPEKTSLHRLLNLFGKGKELQDLKSDFDNAKAKLATFAKAKKFEFIKPAINKSQLKSNEVEIEKLYKEKEQLLNQNSIGATDIDSATAQKLALIKTQLSELYRNREWINVELNQINEDAKIGSSKIMKDFESLLEFFPNANIRRIQEIEDFHSMLKRALTSERKNAENKLSQELEQLNSAIEKLESDLKEIATIPNIPEAVIYSCGDLSSRISKLEKANLLFLENEILKGEVQKLKQLYEDTILELLNKISLRLNHKLEKLSEEISGTNIYAPSIEIKSAASYEFYVPKDSGTGTQVRATFLLDFALLTLTPLPAIAHDTTMTKQVQDDIVVRLLEMYKTSSKQIFVAIDKAETFIEGELPKVVKESTVIKLDENNKLFGRTFNVKQTL